MLLLLAHPLADLELQVAAPDSLYDPVLILNLLNLPFGWGFRPDYGALELIYYVALVSGVMLVFGVLVLLYSCGGTWYQQTSQGSSVVYVVVSDPTKTK